MKLKLDNKVTLSDCWEKYSVESLLLSVG